MLYMAKDFAITKLDGQYHLYYIRHVRAPIDARLNEVDLGHAVSPDLRHWTQLPPVLAAHSEANADYDHIWAPSIFREQSTYIMYFTGVRHDGYVQTTRFAHSSDLAAWHLLPSDVTYGPESVPWALPGSRDFRDMCVIRDPYPTATGGPAGGLMYFVTHPSSEAIAEGIPGTTDTDPNHESYVVGVARAEHSSPLAPYDVKPLWVTHRAYPAGHSSLNILESPTVFSHQSGDSTHWFLIAGAGGGAADYLYAWTAADPAAEPAEWTWRGRLRGLSPGEPLPGYFKDRYGNFDSGESWRAAEYFMDDDGREYLCVLRNAFIEIRQIQWVSGTTFDLVQPLTYETLSVDAGDLTNCATVRVTLTGKNLADGLGIRYAHLEVVRVDASGDSIAMIPNDQVGLPHDLALTSDRTVLQWLPTAVPGESSTRMKIRLRDPDIFVACSPFTVTMSSSCPGGGGGPGVYPMVARTDPSISAGTGHTLELRTEAHGVGSREVRLRAVVPSAQFGRVQIFDLQGREVRRLREGSLPAGEWSLAWDRRNDAGQGVAPGLYFARLTSAMAMRMARVIVTR